MFGDRRWGGQLGGREVGWKVKVSSQSADEPDVLAKEDAEKAARAAFDAFVNPRTVTSQFYFDL